MIKKDNKLDYKNKIFKYINANGNDKLSEYSGLDLQELLLLIDNYYLSLRNNLNLDKEITFGLEIELENTSLIDISRKMKNLNLKDTWHIEKDASLTDGAEIISPILIDNCNTWKDLKKICLAVFNIASVDEKSGGHIHVGTQALGNEYQSWLNFCKLWSTYENIFNRFLYGEYLNARLSLKKYAPPVAEKFKDVNKLFELVDDKFFIYTDQKYLGVSFFHVKNRDIKEKNTIEFRSPNSSKNPIIHQNNINLLVKTLSYCKSSSFNDDIVSKRLISNCDYNLNLDLYNEIYLQQALELADLLFKNNKDKVYFLRQYFKSYEIADPRIKQLQPSKKFTK